MTIRAACLEGASGRPSCSSSPAGRGSKYWCSTAPRCRASAGAPAGPGAAGRRHRGLHPAPRPPLRGETVRQTALPCPPCPALERDPEQVPWRPSRACPAPSPPHSPRRTGPSPRVTGRLPQAPPSPTHHPETVGTQDLTHFRRFLPGAALGGEGREWGQGAGRGRGEKGGGEGQAHPQASSRLTPREPVTFRM